MIWQEDHYVEVAFDQTKYTKGLLDIYDEYRLKNFKKIRNPDCTTKFFNDKGEVNTWYYKRGMNNLEIFTAPGLHPTNGKTLDPITTYMIGEHICKEF